MECNYRGECSTYLEITVEQVQYHHTGDANAQLDVRRMLRQIVAKYAMRGGFIVYSLLSTISRGRHL